MPKRHLHTRFVRDFKEFALEYIDFCHYTVNLNTKNNNFFVFPAEYVGSYGVYEAVRHVYSKTPALADLDRDQYLLTNSRYFAADMEKAIGSIRDDFRAKN